MSTKRTGTVAAAALVILLLGAPAGYFAWRVRQSRARARDEAAAAEALRNLQRFQCEFRLQDLDRNGKQDYFRGAVGDFLAALHIATSSINVPMHPVWQEIYDADATRKAKATSYGYVFLALTPVDPEGYAFCAQPADGGRSGRAALFLDQRGEVYRAPAVQGLPARFPSDHDLERATSP